MVCRCVEPTLVMIGADTSTFSIVKVEGLVPKNRICAILLSRTSVQIALKARYAFWDVEFNSGPPPSLLKGSVLKETEGFLEGNRPTQGIPDLHSL